MRIAQISPLYESVPPKFYGGTERIVSYLTEELVRQGHEVTLFASGDSTTAATLVSPCAQSLRLDQNCIDPQSHHTLLIEQLWADADRFEVIHSHIDYLPFPVFRRLKTPSLTTLHGRLDIPDLVSLYRNFRDIPLISISNAQRKPLPWANWQGTIYHGLPNDLYQPNLNRGTYLAFLGRISAEKRVDRAIEIAKRAGMALKIAAKIDKADKDYFEREIKHLLSDPHVEFIGEIQEHEKSEFLGNAYALLFPIDWPEPFGLVLIESVACGTPVIAFPMGSVPEVITDGVTGYIVNTIEEAVEAIKKVDQLNRERIRQVFEERFTVELMAKNYLSIYARLAANAILPSELQYSHRPLTHFAGKGN